MGGSYSCEISNETNHNLEVNLWLAGYFDETKKFITVEHRSLIKIVFNTPQDHSCFQINTVIAQIKLPGERIVQELFAFRAFKLGRILRIRSSDNFQLQLYVGNEETTDDEIWNGNQKSFEIFKAQMHTVTQILGVASKIGVGLTNQVVRSTLETAGLGKIMSFMGGQIASNIIELGVQAALGQRANEKSVDQQIADQMKNQRLTDIETLLIAICRQIQFIYMPMSKIKRNENADSLKDQLKELLSVFSTGCDFGIMPYLEKLKEYQTSFPLYLNAVSIHLILLNELAMFLVMEEDEETAKTCVSSYMNTYLKNAVSLWESIMEEESQKTKIVRKRKRFSTKFYWKVTYDNNIIYKVSGSKKERVILRAEDIRQAYFNQQKYILHQKFNYPETTFEKWKQLSGPTEEPFSLNLEEITAKIDLS